VVSIDDARETYESDFLDRRGKGYLVCCDCSGYYKLKADESPDDFEECECGGILEYHENLDELIKEPRVDTDITGPYYEQTELKEMLSTLKNKAEKRKQLFEELSERVAIQEELLHDIKEGKWTLWEAISEKDLREDISEQKRLLSEIIQQEDKDIKDQEDLLTTITAQEDRLFDSITKKRAMLQKELVDREKSLILVNSNFVKVFIGFIIVMILFVFIYLYLIMVL